MIVMRDRKYLALLYGVDENLPSHLFYKKIKEINDLALKQLEKYKGYD